MPVAEPFPPGTGFLDAETEPPKSAPETTYARRDQNDRKWVAEIPAQTAYLCVTGKYLRLVSAIARGRRWLDEIISGFVTDAEQIACRERCSVRHVNMTISLAFLAPKLVRAAVEGRLPRGINIARLRDAPSEWSRQFEALGLNPHP
jgi:hypothetical protein